MARGMRTPTIISQQWNCPAEYLLSTAHGIGSSSGMPASDNSSIVSSTNDYPSQAVVGGNEQVQTISVMKVSSDGVGEWLKR